MFGFFSKKPSEPELTRAPDVPKASGSTSENVQQLRTPSPSVAPSNDLHLPPSTPIRPSEEPEQALPSKPEPTTESLHALVSSVPPKTLRAYTITEISKADESMLHALASFFATLQPPPQLHCVRCHSDYVDVENTERSCHVAHDDDTVEVERGGPSGYQTLWGCCEKITPGDGSEGPPDGWCYEGFHTTDIKRARFRADSTPTDDKLKSCLRLNCHGVRDALPRRAKRRREREVDPAEAADDAASSGTEDSGVAEIARGVGALGKKPSTPRKAPKSRGRPKKEKEAGENGMDVDDASSVAASASASAKKPRVPRSRKQPGKEGTEVMEVDPAANASPSAPPSVKRPRGRPRKEATKDGAETGAESDATPARRGRKPKQQSSARAQTPSQVEVVLPQRTRSQSRNARAVSRARPGAGTDGEGGRTDGEGRQRKKRRVAAPASDD